MYTTIDRIEQGYCADVCAPGKCDEGKTCFLEEVQCVAAPCPPIARCSAFDYVGCFKDDEEDRVLGSQYDLSTMSSEVGLAHLVALGGGTTACGIRRSVFHEGSSTLFIFRALLMIFFIRSFAAVRVLGAS